MKRTTTIVHGKIEQLEDNLYKLQLLGLAAASLPDSTGYPATIRRVVSTRVTTGGCLREKFLARATTTEFAKHILIHSATQASEGKDHTKMLDFLDRLRMVKVPRGRTTVPTVKEVKRFVRGMWTLVIMGKTTRPIWWTRG